MHSKNKSTYAASLNLSGQKPCNDSFISFKNLEEAHGIIPYGMTNDYMFRAVLQSNDKVLQGLICSLLHLSKREITSIEIINPVILGKSVENKEFRLDINVLLNNNTVINLDYSDFRFIPINLSKDHFHATSIQVCRNNYSNNLVQAGQ